MNRRKPINTQPKRKPSEPIKKRRVVPTKEKEEPPIDDSFKPVRQSSRLRKPVVKFETDSPAPTTTATTTTTTTTTTTQPPATSVPTPPVASIKDVSSPSLEVEEEANVRRRYPLRASRGGTTGEPSPALSTATLPTSTAPALNISTSSLEPATPPQHTPTESPMSYMQRYKRKRRGEIGTSQELLSPEQATTPEIKQEQPDNTTTTQHVNPSPPTPDHNNNTVKMEQPPTPTADDEAKQAANNFSTALSARRKKRRLGDSSG